MNKKVWIFNHYATDMYKNHGGRHYYFSKYLKEKGYSPTVFCANTYHNKEEVIDTFSKKYIIDYCDGIPFVFIKTVPSIGNGIKRILNMGLFYHNLLHSSKKIEKDIEKPDIILASSVHPLTMVAGIKIAKKFNIPCICEVRDLWPEAIFSFGKIKEMSLIGKILTRGEHWIYKNANAIIFTKPGDIDYLKEKKWLRTFGGDIDERKCFYINNGVDIEAFNNSIEKNKIEDKDLNSNMFNVVYTGAIRPVNNVGMLLDTAKLLKNEKNIQFLIYGNGNQLPQLEKRLKEENIINVKLKGHINKQYIPFVLSKASVNVLNYSQTLYNWKRGNSSNKLFEYMASGKPIISTVKMGYDIIEKYNCGISLNENSPEELSKKIMDIKLMDKEKYIKYCTNAKKGAMEFDFKKLTNKLINIIEGIKQNEN